MDFWCSRVIEADSEEVQLEHLNNLKKEVKESTTSMTSIPKPFKFIKPHYEDLVKFYEELKSEKLKYELSEF